MYVHNLRRLQSRQAVCGYSTSSGDALTLNVNFGAIILLLPKLTLLKLSGFTYKDK